MKVFPQKELWFDEKELKTNLGEGNFIFVGSSTDMFAENVSAEWIISVLHYCKEYPKNKYLFQSKNPRRFNEFRDHFPFDVVFGTTIETNRKTPGKAPETNQRALMLNSVSGKKMITVEPIIDFDLKEMVELIKKCYPQWVNIGADSKKHNLPEPSKEKVLQLIAELNKFTEVKIKNNLHRIIGKSYD
jgi:protein gp37